MKSPVVKRSIVVAGHKTSVSLEEAFWNGMKEISGLRDMTLSELVGEIDFKPPARQSVVGHSPVRAGLFSNPRHLRNRIGFKAARLGRSGRPQASSPGAEPRRKRARRPPRRRDQ